MGLWNQVLQCRLKGRATLMVCNPNGKYILSERALGTINFDASIIKIG